MARVPGTEEQLCPFAVSDEALTAVLECTQSDYVIWWQLDPESKRLVHTKQTNSKRQLNAMRRSRSWEFGVGDGVVGRVFQTGVPEIVQDVNQLDPTVFHRFKLASDYGIASLAFVPFTNGVLEYGSKGVKDSPMVVVANHVRVTDSALLSHG